MLMFSSISTSFNNMNLHVLISVVLFHVQIRASLSFVDQKLQYTSLSKIELKETFGVEDHESIPLHVTAIPEEIFENGTLVSMIVPINGRKIRLNLLPTTDDLISPNLISVQRGSFNSTLSVEPYRKRCHFKSVTDNVFAAISNCDRSYRGIIVVDDGIYVLQPLPPKIQRYKRSSKQHVIYKRNISNPFCGLNDTLFSKDQRRLRDDPPVESPVPTSRLSKDSEIIIELAVFADNELWRKYQTDYGAYADSQLQDFVVALLNNMQILYHHPSITPKVNFKVVRYEVLKSQPADFIATSDAQYYLDSFCNYQYKLGNRNWDHSLLLTGYDMVRFGNDRSISGIARLHGVCDTANACTVAEGLDFTATFIATHEIGHSLGMRHDEPYCTSDFIMSGSLGPGKVSWSTCSVADLQKTVEKLDYYGKNCLRQTGSESAQLNVDGNTLPGQKFSADQQCALMHGSGYKQVKPWTDSVKSICYMMWCSQNKYGKIVTSHPALEGTNCEPGNYCIRGECSPYGGGTNQVRPQITDGAWSSWSTVECSSCKCTPIIGGIGVIKSTRTCTNPAPANGGKDCVGTDRTRGIVCSTSCSVSTHTLEAYMTTVCTNRKTEKNDQELLGTGTQLTTYDARACKVFCDIRNSAGQKSFRAFGDLLPDGTWCGTGKYCIEGECLGINCGNTALISTQSSCLSSSESCVQQTSGVVTVPPVVTVAPPSWSEWSAWSSCSATCGPGTIIRRRACSGSTCVGVADESLTCNVATCQAIAVPTPTAMWSYWSEWSSCSQTCGRGQRRKARSCQTRNCNAAWEESIEPCGSDYCPWTEWAQCSVTCGEGKRTRYRFCPGGFCKAIDNYGANNTESCVMSACAKGKANMWLAWSAWSSCSVTCGPGTRNRNRYCSGIDCVGDKNEIGQCEQSSCTTTGRYYEWSDWSICSQTCNSGTQSRTRQCSTSQCDGASSETNSCNSQLCGNDILADDVGSGLWSQWNEWSQCSRTCGKGGQMRIRGCRRGSCKGEKSEEQSCYLALCAQWGGWSWWSNCDGVRTVQKRIRNCYGSGTCDGDNHETKAC